MWIILDGSVPASDLGVRFKLDDENGIYTGIATYIKMSLTLMSIN